MGNESVANEDKWLAGSCYSVYSDHFPILRGCCDKAQVAEVVPLDVVTLVSSNTVDGVVRVKGINGES